MDIDAIYRGIVDGTGDAGDLEWTRRKLQLMALDHTIKADADARMGALRVASVLGPVTARPIVERLMRDPDPAVRTWAFNQAVAARADGVPLLRDAAGGADEMLALAALDLLTARVDRASLPTVRRLLTATSSRIRAAAARLCGHVGGPAVLVQLRPLTSDPDAGVRREATEAIERIQGDRPIAAPQDWWDDGEPELPSPPPVATGADRLVPPPAHVAPEPEPEHEHEHEPPTISDPAAKQLPTPAAVPDDPDWDGTWSALPSPLPTETRALAKLLGMIAPSDHGPVLAALQRPQTAQELGILLGGWPKGGDPALGRGLALAAAALRRSAAFSKLRQMASDPQATVRAAATQGIGTVGGASALPLFQHLLHDPEPEVRAAAASALATLATRIGRQDIAKDYLDRMADEQPEQVAAAIATARGALEP